MAATLDRGVGDELFELPGELAVAGVLYYTSFAVIMLLMLLNFLIAIISEAYIQTQEDGNETASFFQELGSLVSKWWEAGPLIGLLTFHTAFTRPQTRL